MTKNTCSICGFSLTETLLEITEPDRFELALGVARENYLRQWKKCGQCGVAQDEAPASSVRARENLSEKYYEIDLGSEDKLREKFDLILSLPREKSDNALRVGRIIEFLRNFSLPPLLNAMDIGSGTGVFLAKLIQEFSPQTLNCLAVEPDPVAAKHLKSIQKFQVFQGLLEERNGSENFHLVTLNKVLEHIREPLPVLQSIGRLMDKDFSILYVEVPDIWTIQLRSPKDNILGSVHHHLYDVASLSGLLSRAGYDTIESNRIFEPSGKVSVYAFATTKGMAGKLEAQHRR